MKKKPGINQKIGKRKDNIAALDQHSIEAAHKAHELWKRKCLK